MRCRIKEFTHLNQQLLPVTTTVLSLAQVWILVFIHEEQKVSKEEDPKSISCGNEQHHLPGGSISEGS